MASSSRQLWFRKAFDAVTDFEGPAPRSTFGDDEAIVRFGVGKNMVSAISSWATACRMVEEVEGGYSATKLAHLLFDPEKGLDPYCEKPATAWLMHWFLASKPHKAHETTTLYFLFIFNGRGPTLGLSKTGGALRRRLRHHDASRVGLY